VTSENTDADELARGAFIASRITLPIWTSAPDSANIQQNH